MEARYSCRAWKARVSQRWPEQRHRKRIFMSCHCLSSCDDSPGPLPFFTHPGPTQPMKRKKDDDLAGKSVHQSSAGLGSGHQLPLVFRTWISRQTQPIGPVAMTHLGHPSVSSFVYSFSILFISCQSSAKDYTRTISCPPNDREVGVLTIPVATSG